MAKQASDIVAKAFAVVLVVGAISLVPVVAWYCVDDRIASYVGIEEIGSAPFSFVYPAAFLVSWLKTSVITMK